MAATLYWLARLDWSGRPLFWATTAVDVEDRLGNILPHAGGLVVAFQAGLDMFSDGPTGIPSVTIGPLLLPEDLDVPALVEAGHALDGVPLELSLWWDDTDYDDRIKMATGISRLPAYGTSAEGLEFGFEPHGTEDLGRIIGPREVVSEDTWPLASEDDVGRTYPRVYGRPGLGRTPRRPRGASLTSTFEMPVLIAFVTEVAQTSEGTPPVTVTSDNEVLLVAGHVVAATEAQVWLDLEDDGAQGRRLYPLVLPIISAPDRLGHVCSIIETPILHTSFTNLTWYIDFAHEDTDEGGVFSRRTPGVAMYGAGEQMLDLLSFSSAPVDVAGWAALRDALDRYRLDFFIDDPEASPLDFIYGNISPLIPMSILLGPNGLRPWLWQPESARPAFTLTSGINASRAGMVEYAGEIFNEYTIRYAPNGPGALRRAVTLTGAPRDQVQYDNPLDGDTGEHIVLSSSYARASWTRYGRRIHPVIDAIVVYDKATACKIVSWMARVFGFAWRTIRYQIDPADATRVQLGDDLLVNDAELALVNREALIVDLAWDDLDPEIEVLIMDGPPGAITPEAEWLLFRGSDEIDVGDTDALGNVSTGGVQYTWSLYSVGLTTATATVAISGESNCAVVVDTQPVDSESSEIAALVMTVTPGGGAFSATVTMTTNVPGAKASWAFTVSGTGV